MARTKTDDPEARARIAEAAENLFAARGYDGTPIRDIAKKAGVNGAMIHYYFGSKEGLYRSILEAAASRVRELLVDTSSRAASSRDRLASFVEAYAEYILNHPNLARILYREMLTGGKHLMKIAQQYAITNYNILRNTITEGVESGELRKVDVDLAPISLMGMVVIFQFLRPFITVALDQTEYDDRFVDRIATHTFDLFLNGIASERVLTRRPKTVRKTTKRSAKSNAKVQKP